MLFQFKANGFISLLAILVAFVMIGLVGACVAATAASWAVKRISFQRSGAEDRRKLAGGEI